ncbi:uncharacterized protein [Miscanthus floridulus]|uniref:uncharacterized protein n=1 Tax=Miscanthus floridulus TaxID=154761 RepID=UPI0034599126
MALEAKQAALCFKKVLRLSVRKSYRFVSEHPILFGLGVLLYLLYRSSPRLFVFLLSSSPVIICTALLLGILLSYGEINLPEASEDHKGTPEVSTSKVGNSSSDTHFEENQRPSVLEFRENASNFKERENKQTVSFRERASEHVDLDDYVPLLKRADEEDERGDRCNIPRTPTPFPSVVNLYQESGIGEDITFTKKRQSEGPFFIQDMADCQTSLFDEARLSGLNDKDAPFGLFSSSDNVNKHAEMEENLVFADSGASKERAISEEKHTEELSGTSEQAASVLIHQLEKNGELNVDTSNVVEDNLLDSSHGSPWARVSSQDGSSGFDSDQAESSSPDASMTDIGPVLDEIDPLLGADSNRPSPIPKDDSDTDSHVSEDHQIDDDSNDEGDDIDAKDNVEGKKKNDGKETAFLWTADDEKNLMDLGYSEMERNRRLEILMARRRSRKNIKSEIDNNLTDVDSNGAGRSLDDLSRFRAHVPLIAVPRRNPFDLPYDSEEAAIPGSAPSILHARKNSFDLPLEQSNDSVVVPAPDSLNSGEPVMSPRCDTIFRRHESFNFGRIDAIQEKRFSRLKPYFVAETVEWNASNFQRQFSDKSESKMSSVTESDIASSVADQEDHKDHDEKDLADVGSECSDGINSIDVEQDNSDIDDREIALQHFVFERSQEREAHLASTKGKGHEEDYTPKSAGSSTMPFHAVPDLLSWEDGDGSNSLGAKPSFQLNTEVKCSEWVSSSGPPVEGESHSGDLPEYLDTEVASSSNTVVLGASNTAEKGGNVDLMSYSNNEMPLDNLIHGSMELPSEFVTETLPVISRDLHPIPEERVVENFNMQEKHETAIFTDSAAALTGHVIEQHFDVGSDGTLSSEVVSSYPQANDVIQSPSSGHEEILNPFVLMAAEPKKVDISDMYGEATAGYILDSDDEADKIYPEPMEGSGIDESFLSELDAVGDFGVEPMRLDQQVTDQASHDDIHTNSVAADSVISPQTSDVSLTLSEVGAEDSREQSSLVDDLNGPEFGWSFGASHDDPEQTVYNPRRRILEASPFEAMNMELKPPHDESEVPADDTPSPATLAAGSSEPEVTINGLVTSTTDPEITVLDAKSLEDIETAFKLVSDGVVSEATMDTEALQISGADAAEPKGAAGELHVIDAKSVDDMHAAFQKHFDAIVNSCFEENEDKYGHVETAESTKADELTEAIHNESQHNLGDAREALPVEGTSNMSTSEAESHDDIDAASNKVFHSCAKSTAQAVELEVSHEREEESEHQ